MPALTPSLRTFRSDPLPILVFAAGLALQGILHLLRGLQGVSAGLALDDGFIHLTVARNLIEGFGFSYNPGQWVAGTTSPAWSMALAAFSLGFLDLLTVAMVWGAIFYAATGAFVCWMMWQLGISKRSSVLGGIMTLLAGRLIWAGASGMEICAFALFSLAGAFSHIRDRRRGVPSVRTGFILGMASLLRPEGYLLYALTVADHGLHYDPAYRLFHVTLRPYRTRAFAMSVCVYLALILPYVLFCLATNGHPFPNTYYAKMNENFLTDRGIYLSNVVRAHLDYPHGFFLWLAPAGALAIMFFSYTKAKGILTDYLRILWLWPVSLVAHGLLFNPSLLPHFQRYVMPLLPFSIVLSVIGFEVFCEFSVKKWNRRLINGLAVLFVACGVAGAPRWMDLTIRSIDNINDLHVRTGKWIADHTPPDALIATHDVGAIAYFGQREVLDVLGLVSTDVMQIIVELNRRGEGAINSYDILMHIAERKPDYLAGFPSWMGAFATQEEAFEKVFETRIRENVISGSDTMAVWKANWERFDPEKALPIYRYGYGYGYGAYAGPASMPASLPLE